MNKEIIYKIIDNKISYFNLSDYINQSEYYVFNGLLNALKLNKSITTLDLSLEYYSKNILKKINIKNIIKEISKFINTKTNITTLVISNTDLKLNDFKVLFDALQFNTSIKTLDLSNNKIDDFLDQNYYKIIGNINTIYSYYNTINAKYELEKEDKTNLYQTYYTIKDQLTPLRNILVKNNSFFKMLLKNKTITTLNLTNNKYRNETCCYNEDEINVFNEILQQNNILKNLNISYRFYPLKNILNFIKNNKCIETLTITLKVAENTKDNVELIRKYYNENEYLQEIIII